MYIAKLSKDTITEIARMINSSEYTIVAANVVDSPNSDKLCMEIDYYDKNLGKLHSTTKATITFIQSN
jgi:hypothetical protein